MVCFYDDPVSSISQLMHKLQCLLLRKPSSKTFDWHRHCKVHPRHLLAASKQRHFLAELIWKGIDLLETIEQPMFFKPSSAQNV